ncbi:hypothetical protein [uncultured Microbulbifer sp.]|uniref:hypothetical protein n=1 Tax=uncultured Microbulbifer sp. TaxID=348147 RepID=UPI0025FC8F53|nr:hypothetical protein [uncultured Microbulbifer sp.]
MNKDIFIAEVSRRFEQLFKLSKNGYRTPDVERHRLEGFTQAGIFLGITDRPELERIMEDVHLRIFGKTIAERKAESISPWVFDAIDYSAYEYPTYERKK